MFLRLVAGHGPMRSALTARRPTRGPWRRLLSATRGGRPWCATAGYAAWAGAAAAHLSPVPARSAAGARRSWGGGRCPRGEVERVLCQRWPLAVGQSRSFGHLAGVCLFCSTIVAFHFSTVSGDGQSGVIIGSNGPPGGGNMKP